MMFVTVLPQQLRKGQGLQYDEEFTLVDRFFNVLMKSRALAPICKGLNENAGKFTLLWKNVKNELSL